MQDVDMEPAPPSEPEPVDPAIEGLYRVMGEIEKSATDAIEEAKNESIKAIEKTKKESIVLSYRMLIAGAIFGFLGSFFVATLLRWYDAGWVLDITNKDCFAGILGIVAFSLCTILVIRRLVKIKQS